MTSKSARKPAHSYTTKILVTSRKSIKRYQHLRAVSKDDHDRQKSTAHHIMVGSGQYFPNIDRYEASHRGMENQWQRGPICDCRGAEYETKMLLTQTSQIDFDKRRFLDVVSLEDNDHKDYFLCTKSFKNYSREARNDGTKLSCTGSKTTLLYHQVK